MLRKLSQSSLFYLLHHHHHRHHQNRLPSILAVKLLSLSSVSSVPPSSSSELPPPDQPRIPDKIKEKIEQGKSNLQWRKPYGENSNDWKTKFSLFGEKEQNSDFITMMQQPIDLSPSAIKKWWLKRKERTERYLQQYIPERNEILGNDLATAHFIIYRGGAIKFLHKFDWYRANENGEYDLPAVYHGGYKVEAIRCDRMTLYYEGLENIRRLQHLKFLSFLDVKTFDDWSLDRVSGSENPILEVLDLTGTKITHRGLSCLYRISSLKLLIIDNPKITKEMELSCAMLEECLPKLRICAANEIH